MFVSLLHPFRDACHLIKPPSTDSAGGAPDADRPRGVDTVAHPSQVDDAAAVVAEAVLRGAVGKEDDVIQRDAGRGFEVNGCEASAKAIRRGGGKSRLHVKSDIPGIV